MFVCVSVGVSMCVHCKCLDINVHAHTYVYQNIIYVGTYVKFLLQCFEHFGRGD